MHYVYRIQSQSHPTKGYTGFTSDLKKRIQAHNEGNNTSTAPYRPWKLAFYCAFEEKEKALDFERYLKSGSGKAFSNKRLF